MASSSLIIISNTRVALIVLIILIASAQGAKYLGVADDGTPSSVYLATNISNQIVQERETITLPLSNYFKGSLLDF
jgi:hypothetical protein